MKPLLPSLQAIRAEQARRSLAHFVRQAWLVVEPSTPLVWNWHLDVICQHVQALVEGRLAHPNLIINVPPGSMKPCHHLSMVNERTRGQIELRDVREGDYVLTHKGRFRRVMAVADQGVLPLLEIVTKQGRTLRLAPDHPLLTARGWIRADTLTIQDVLAEVHPIESSGSETVSAKEARMLGYLIGDGCMSQADAASFTNQDPDSIADFIACAESLGFTAKACVRPGGSTIVKVCGGPGQIKGVPRAERKGIIGPVRQWVRCHGIEKSTSYSKRVPDAILAGTEQIIAEFIAAYWACDGGIYDRRDAPRAGRDGHTVNAVRIEASTVSEALGRDLQHLFARLGMSFRLMCKARQLKTRRQGDLYEAWYLSAADQDTAAKFMAIIGPLMRHEKNRRAQGLVRKDFDRVLNPDPVKSITTIDPGPCRCLSVDEDHSFTIEDIAVHNSTILSVALPAWMWLQKPGWRGIFASGNEGIAIRDSIKCRDILDSDWYRSAFQPSWSFTKDQNAKGHYKNTASGFRKAISAGARITGDRGDCIVVDDPNDAAEIFSKPARDQIITWWDQAAANRLNDLTKGNRIIIQQRLHEEDLTGHILATEGEFWETLIIRQEYEPPGALDPDARPTSLGWTDPRTEPGRLFFPARFPMEVVAGEKRRLGASGYAGQHQQRPSPAEGGLFKRAWLQSRYGMDPRSWVDQCERVAQSWDLSFKGSDGSDWVVGQVWACKGADRYLLDQIRARMDFTTTVQAFRDFSRKWPRATAKLVEDKANGPALISSLQREIGGILAISPKDSKEARASLVTPLMEAGNVHFPATAPWVSDLVEELAAFPRGAHDDQVDALTQFLAWDLLRSAEIRITPIGPLRASARMGYGL